MAQFKQKIIIMAQQNPMSTTQGQTDPVRPEQPKAETKVVTRQQPISVKNPANIKRAIAITKQNKPVIDVSNPNIATDQQIIQFFGALARIVSTTELTDDQKGELLLGVCELFQKGAVSPKFDKSRRSQLFSGTLTVANLQEAARSIDRNLTLRKIARGLKDVILEVAREWAIPGNLAKKYSQAHPDATISELIWASDFFTFSEHQDMPDTVRDWLINNYSSRFDK